MTRLALLGAFGLLAAACGGDPEKDRICLGKPCPRFGQSPDCAAYVACFEKTGGTPGSLDSSYGRNGLCWMSPQAQSSCTEACKSAIQSLRSAFPEAGCALTVDN